MQEFEEWCEACERLTCECICDHLPQSEVQVKKELPQYVSHKQVGALKIQSIERAGSGHFRVHFGAGHDSRIVPADMTTRYMPKAGDYYVEYADNYKSFSPAKAFEEGYKPLDGGPNAS